MDNVKSYAEPVQLNEVMQGEGVGEVIETKNTRFKIGDLVVGGFGWVSHAKTNGDNLRRLPRSNIPEQTALGVLGMPGHTAWVGLNKIAGALTGETILVSAATGAGKTTQIPQFISRMQNSHHFGTVKSQSFDAN